MPKKIRILLADDHTLVREGLSRLISEEADMQVVGEAGNGVQALRLAQELRPDVVVMDLAMPELDGLEATKQLKVRRTGVKVVVLTMEADEAHLRELCQAGAAGYVLKRSAGEELIEAIRIVAAGGFHYDARLTAKALAAQPGAAASASDAASGALSPREKEVLVLLAWGHSSKEVGARLSLSPKTVDTYKVRIGEKLGLHSRVEMVRFALRQGWLNETDSVPKQDP